MTPIYGRSICNDPVTPPLHFGRFSAQGDIKCNDPTPVTTPLHLRGVFYRVNRPFVTGVTT